MADGMCDFGDDGHPRNHIITTLAPFSSIELCDDHYAPGLIPLLAANLGVPPMDLYQAIERFLKAEAKKAARDLADAQAAEQAKGSQDPPPPGDPDTGLHAAVPVPNGGDRDSAPAPDQAVP